MVKWLSEQRADDPVEDKDGTIWTRGQMAEGARGRRG